MNFSKSKVLDAAADFNFGYEWDLAWGSSFSSTEIDLNNAASATIWSCRERVSPCAVLIARVRQGMRQ